MAAHAARTVPAPLPSTPERTLVRPPIRRPALRPLLWLAAMATVLAVLVPNASAVQAAAHAACTYGTEPGTTCGEALYLLGFPV